MTEEYPNIGLSRKVGQCGRLHAIFAEHEGKFFRLFLKGAMNKSTPCGDAWLVPISNLITFALRRGLKEGMGVVERGIIKQLCGERCNTVIPNEARVCSCADAIGKMVKEYLTMKKII